MKFTIFKPRANKNGFTLVEMIIYISIFAVILFVIVQLFWQVQITSVKSAVVREVKENSSQVIEMIKYNVRKSEGVNIDGSVFNSNPGILVLGEGVIDTYTKNVGSVNITKLRFTENGNPSVDLTSDHVSVTNLAFTNLTSGVNSESILMDLELSYANPGYDTLYDHSLSTRLGVRVRNEI